MKKIGMLLLAMMMIFTMVACGKENEEEKTPSGNSNQQQTTNNNNNATTEKTLDELAEDIAKGFGQYEGKTIVWRVLEIDRTNKRALMITDECVGEMFFHNSEPTEELTWESSDLRNWLANEFYQSAFTNEQKSKILEVTNSADTNSESSAHGGNDTVDQVFVLSASEMIKYFDNDEDMAATFNGEAISYWTRTPGDDTQGYVCTYAGSAGGLYMTGNWATTMEVAVRPAIWVNLSDASTNSSSTGNADTKKDFEVPTFDESKRTSDLVITSMKMSKTSYKPNEEIVVTIKWTGTPNSSAWVGIVPADVPHGDEYVNDDADLDYIYLDGHEGSDFTFTYPLEPGNYTMRVNEYDDGGPELGWVAFKVEGTPINQEETEESSDVAAIAKEIFDFDVPIVGIPDEWKKGIGEVMYGMETSTDGSDFSQGYLQQFKNVSSEDFVTYKAYFDTLDFIFEADGVYDCHWGQLQIGHNSETSEMTISWYVLR